VSETPRRVHFVAIGGTGMGSLAGLLHARGVRVTGSDDHLYPPMSTLLEGWGIPVNDGFRAEHALAADPDLVVIGNAVRPDNPEARAVIEEGLPYRSFSDALYELAITGKHSVVVSGTHGKTTTTSLLASLLLRCGRDPSLLVGGHALDFDGSFREGDGDHFVVEGDEYDTAFFDKTPKFLHYHPRTLVVTSVEFDHADIYRDLDAVKAAFRRFVDLLPAGAPLVVAQDFPHAVEIAAGAARARSISFGATNAAEWSLSALRDSGGHTAFGVLHRGAAEGELRLEVPGRMNALNALGAYVLARAIGLTHAEIAPGLASFSGVARRQELVGEFRGVTLVDDFAHHPTAVAGTLAALRQRYPGRRLWGIFEPRSNSSRRRVFQQDYVDALAAADAVILAAVVRKESDQVPDSELFSAEQLVGDLCRRGQAARCLESSEAIAAALAREVAPGDIVVMMSNGDFGGLRSKLVAALHAP
jgi:UDP-N-acetylmuramate: L-alanyl-gamma-D-glutamyl-meso-diaminopimelate ligase